MRSRCIVAARLHHDHRSRRIGIMGLRQDATLIRLKTKTGHFVDLPPDGLVISKKLASVLGVKACEKIRVEVLQEKRPVADVLVVDLLDDITGLNAYMNIDALNRLIAKANKSAARCSPSTRATCRRSITSSRKRRVLRALLSARPRSTALKTPSPRTCSTCG